MISPEAHAVLLNAWTENNAVKLPPDELPRPVYEEVDECLRRLGGVWKGGKTKAHVFAFYDPAPLLAAVQASGLMPPKNPTAFFPTPKALVDDMVRIADLRWYGEESRILEPSAGTGAIANAIQAACDARLDCCEVLDLNRAVLEGKGHTVVAEDFLTWQPGAVYDCILMNPPFAVEGDKSAWLTHLQHAWTLLKDGGQLVCIAPAGLKFQQRLTPTVDWILAHGSIDDIPAGTFKESGTGIATQLIWMAKNDQAWRDTPHQGYPSYHQWLLFLHKDNELADSETWNDLVNSKADDAAVLTFLGEVVASARKLGDYIAWNEREQQHALAHFREESGRETIELPVVLAQSVLELV